MKEKSQKAELLKNLEHAKYRYLLSKGEKDLVITILKSTLMVLISVCSLVAQPTYSTVINVGEGAGSGGAGGQDSHNHIQHPALDRV